MTPAIAGICQLKVTDEELGNAVKQHTAVQLQAWGIAFQQHTAPPRAQRTPLARWSRGFAAELKVKFLAETEPVENMGFIKQSGRSCDGRAAAETATS